MKAMTMAELGQAAAVQGKCLIGFDGHVYDISNWLDHHPGGALAILHVNGKDATDHIRAFHPEHVWEVQMKKFLLCQLVLSPAEMAESTEHRKLSKSFNELKQRITDAGLFETSHSFYQLLLLRYVIHFVVSILLCLYLPKPLNAVLGGAAVASFWQQIAFFSHDAGHSCITKNRFFDSLLGTVLATLFGGLSLGWWKHSHNVHHIVTNHPEHDPDIQHMPVFAINKSFCNNLFSSYKGEVMDFGAAARWFVSIQHYTYFSICALGRFNLYVLSYAFLAKDYARMQHASVEMAGLLGFWAWYSALTCSMGSPLLGAVFLLTSHILSSILHLQINVSHFGMSTEDLDCDEHFAAKALRTTMDVDCPQWLDWFHGGLQFQVIHHLFPRMPRHNLRHCVSFVRDFCAENELQYHAHGFVKGNGMVLDNLRDVARHVQFLLSTME
jgi:delta8-fatty-acid desaturase